MTRRALIFAAPLLALLVVAAPARADWVWPVTGEVITPYRNADDPYAAGQHRGIDIAAALGVPVVAATGGEVRFAGTAGSSGLTVSIRTADGRFDTSYLHLSVTAVRKGQTVSAGERVGAVGTTGRRSAGQPHLHFGVRDAGSEHAYHDPLAFLPPPALAPQRPRPAPGPVPEPLTPEPGRAPVVRPTPAPAPHAQPRRLPRPRSAPRAAPDPAATPEGAPHGVPRSAPLPRSAPHVAPRRTPLPGGAPRGGPQRTPLPRSAPGHTGRRSPVPLPASAQHRAPASSGTPAQRLTPAPTEAQTPNQSHRGEPGPDLALALACLGLLAAAALLGLSEDGREATRRSRDRVAGALRPLMGRR